VTWSSSDARVLTVSSQGVVTAVAAGTAQLLAVVDGTTGTATVTVQRVPVASVRVDPATLALGVGATGQLTATPRDAGGTPLAGRAVTWTSDNDPSPPSPATAAWWPSPPGAPPCAPSARG
jgi:uncharacterized protein YjdB